MFTDTTMRYPVNLTACKEGGFAVTFPDIPEAITQGENREEALKMALDALVTAFEFYFEDNEAIPAPSPVTADFVEVPAAVVAKVLLLNQFAKSEMSQSELARRMHCPRQEVTRLFDLKHNTKINTVQKALAVLGQRLELSVA